MKTHETVRKMTDKQRGSLVAAMAGAIPADFSFDEAQAIEGAKGPFVAEIRAVFVKRRQVQTNAVPADDEWFNLTVNDDINPMDVVISAGYNADGWKYLGPELSGTRTLRVKLTRLGYARNLREAEEKADKLGYRLVEGQAREPFKAKFPKPDGKGSVIFGGSEWQDPDGGADVAYLNVFEDEWHSHFLWSGSDFDDDCRWLIVGK
jgi:hypothetical protein